jgi:hypothetical protein
MTLSYTTITGTFDDGSGTALSGTAVFTPSATVYAASGPVVTAGIPVSARINSGSLQATGGGALSLLATDNANVTVEGETGFWYWTVAVTVNSTLLSPFSFFLPSSPSTVDLFTLANTPAGGSSAGGLLAGQFLASDYGADPTYTSDSTSGITAAIEAAEAYTEGSSAGAEVIFEPGHYKISGDLPISSENIALVAVGPGGGEFYGNSVLIQQTSTTANGITAANAWRTKIKGISLQGPGSGSGVGIALNYTTTPCGFNDLEDVYVTGFGSHGITAETPIMSTMTRVWCTGNGGYGTHFTGGGTSCTFRSCWMPGNTLGGWWVNGNYCQWSGCGADGNSGPGWTLSGCQGCDISGSGAEDNDTYSLYFTASSYACTVNGFWCSNKATGLRIDASCYRINVSGFLETPLSGAVYSIDIAAGAIVTLIDPQTTSPVNIESGGSFVKQITDNGMTTGGTLQGETVVASGISGATAGAVLAGGTTSGPPVSGTFTAGTFDVDHTGRIWVCSAPGSPGTWQSFAGLLTPTAVQTAAYTANPGDFVPCDTTTAWNSPSAGLSTVTLPTAPADKTVIGVKIVASAGTVNAVTFACGGSDVINVASGSQSGTLSLLDQGIILQYAAGPGIWYVYGDDLPLSQLKSLFLQGTYPENTTQFLRADGTFAVPPGTGGSGGAWFVPASSDTTGTDDTANFQTALTAARTAGGGRVQGVPGSTYYLKAYLVIGTGCTLDMTDCTVNLVSPGTGALTRNYAAVNAAASASDAAITSGQSVITTSLGASAVAGQSVVVAGAGGAGISHLTGLVSAQTATTITITNLDGSALTASVTVSAAAISLYTRDTNVHVKGGNWNIPSGLGGTAFANYCFVFGHLDHYSAEIQSFTTASSGRCILQYDATDGYVDAPDISGNVIEFAGVYVVGPLYGLVVNRVTGATYDDFTCLSGTDITTGVASSGNVKNVSFRYINGTSSHDNSLRIVAGAGCTIDQVIAGQIQGASAGIYIGDYPANTQMTGGSYGLIDLGTVSLTATTAITLEQPSATEIRAALNLPLAFGVSTGVLITSGDTTAVTIGTLAITGVAYVSALISHNTQYVTVAHLICEAVTYVRGSGSGYLLQLAASGATVQVADIIACDATLNLSCDLVGVVSGAVLDYLNITGGLCAGPAAIFNDAGTSSPVVTFGGGFECTSTQYIAVISGASGTKTLVFAGCSFASITTDGVRVTGTAPVTVLKGDLVKISGSPTMISLSASQSVEAIGLALPLDISQLIRTGVGDMANNTNATLTAHTGSGDFPLGPCVSSGSGSAGNWVSLVNSTYTY